MVNFNFNGNETYNNECNNILSKFINEGKCNDWYNLDIDIDSINALAYSIRDKYDAMVVIGIGGSYLGSRAIIDSLKEYKKGNSTEIIFVGNNLSSDYIHDILEYINCKNICINVISKSGNTLETLISFDILLDYMKNKYDDYKDRIIVTTNSESGKLLEYSNTYGFRRLNVSNNTVGRFSVLSEVGLLPVAVAGYNINKIVEGAKNSKKNIIECFKYVSMRQEMYDSGIYIESFDIYEPKLYYFTEWIKQLFNETQGKDNKGIMAISTINTCDLHSIEQYYQAGKVNIFSTVIFNHSKNNIVIDKYNKTLDEINLIASKSVIEARKHRIKSNFIEVDELNEENIGYLIYFFEISSMIGSYLLEIDYYNQPNVEEYKNCIKSALND